MSAKSILGVLLQPCKCSPPTGTGIQHLSELLRASSIQVDQNRGKHRSPTFIVRAPTRKPWHVRKWTQKRDEDVTPSNEAFIKEALIDKFTSPIQSPLKEEPWPRNPYQNDTRRSGVLALKLGTMRHWTKTGEAIFVTLLQVLDNHVINYVPPEVYSSYPSHKFYHEERFGLQVVGALGCDPRMFSKAYNNLFVKAGVPPKRWLTRFLVTPDAAIEPGTSLSVNHFRVGDYVDVQARTRDWGFQGVMKRWHFKGMPKTHGVTKSHRKPGSTGGGGDKDGVWRGKKLPGIMGNRLSTQAGLKIWRINTKYNILYVHGPSVAGMPHTFCRVRDTYIPKKRIKAENAGGLPMPTWYPEDIEEPLPEEMFDDGLFQFSEPTLEVPVHWGKADS